MTDSQTGHHKSSRKKSFSLKALLLLVTLVALGIIGKQQWDKYQNRKMLVDWIRQFELSFPNPNESSPTANVGCPNTSFSKEQVLAVLMDGALNLREEFQRLYCVKLLAEQYPDDARESLVRIALHSRDVEVQCAAINLVGFCRDANAVARLEPLLRKDVPEKTKVAILDCIGFTRFPAYEVGSFEPSHWTSIFTAGKIAMLNTNPRILPGELFKAHLPDTAESNSFNQKPVSGGVQLDENTQFVHVAGDLLPLCKDEKFPSHFGTLLTDKMLRSDSSKIRHAAARGLLLWPHDNYQLRIAEWGVWINANGQFQLAESVVDEVPDFVHSTGDDLSSFIERTKMPTVIDKPVMHITVDHPMVVDIDVTIRQGRTWFSYPIPDDYSIAEWGMKDKSVEGFAPPNAKPLPSTAEGYPWLLPESGHKQFITKTIDSVGLRWQSLIVTPEKLSGLELPTVSDNPKHSWWKRLREVAGSFVTNRNDTEKFLYYDGPTFAEPPLKIEFDRPKITFTPQPIFPDNFREDYELSDVTPETSRKAFYIHVADEKVTACEWDVRTQETFDVTDAKMMDRETTRAAMLKALSDAGLHTSEADGLLDCWAPQFFDTPGQRIVFFLHREEYDAMCPLKVRPKPTELERVGLVLTELKVN